MGLKVRAVALLAWAKGRRRFDFQVLTRNGREPICDLSAEKMRRERTELQKHSFLRIWKFCWQRAFLEQILWYPFLQVYLTRICWPLIFTLVLCYFGWLLMTFFLSSGPKKKKKNWRLSSAIGSLCFFTWILNCAILHVLLYGIYGMPKWTIICLRLYCLKRIRKYRAFCWYSSGSHVWKYLSTFLIPVWKHLGFFLLDTVGGFMLHSSS